MASFFVAACFVAGLGLLSYRLSIWQIDREYAEYRRATAACFKTALPLINSGRYAEAQALVARHISEARGVKR